jgi:hypothetical protein
MTSPPNQPGSTNLPYGEATARVFERALDSLGTSLPSATINRLRRLAETGKLSDIEAVDRALKPVEDEDGNQ